jgi:hypothetical protein
MSAEDFGQNDLMPSNSSNLRRKIAMVCAVLLVCIVGYFALGWGVYYWKEYVHHYESGAVSDLFALHTMQENYKKDHGSFAGTFSQLGLPLGASLNGDLLTWGRGPYRYRIAWTARDQTGNVVEYRIAARPIAYSNESKRSFLMDQTGMIHFTAMNRDAVSGDQRIASQR